MRRASRSVRRRRIALVGCISATLAIASSGLPVAAAGPPYLVEDIDGNRSSWPIELTPFGNKLMFTANDRDKGRELWKSNGTEQGTKRVKDIDPGAAGSAPTELTDVAGTLYFTANTAAQGRELWKSDGTAAGTVLVKDIRPGKGSSKPRELTAVGGILYFTANDGTSGRELWMSHGTRQGTALVKDIHPGPGDAFGPARWSTYQQSVRWPAGWLTSFDGKAYFAARSGPSGAAQLWSSDGTAAGTTRARDGAGQVIRGPEELTEVGAALFFRVAGSSDAFDPELWVTDGSAPGTEKLSDVDAYLLTKAGGTLFFASRFHPYPDTHPDLWHRRAIWKCGGTPATTEPVLDVLNPWRLVDVAGTLFFHAGRYNERSLGLWKTDGTEPGTELLRDWPAGTDAGDAAGAVGSLYFFTMWGVPNLWVSDGTVDGTNPMDPPPDSADELTEVGGTLYFRGVHHNRFELWRYVP